DPLLCGLENEIHGASELARLSEVTGCALEGKNIVIEYRSAEGNYDRLPELAAELVRLKPDVLVTSATPATLAAKQATTTIPIVMVDVSAPVGSGIVASFAHPGGNITGLTDLGSEL